ncbi:MAG: hypothetical protein H6527_06920 [Actinobacteria bacterium]|nr:hypothetical protein [Actinomycetota bacterium]
MAADRHRSVGDPAALGLSTVVDLRTAVEVQRAPDVDLDVQYVWLDVLRDYAMASAVGLEDVLPIRSSSRPSCGMELLRR